ncbi:LacI family DNA-binding transcriptional regulator [Chelativorans sp.]|uniref:LacI family DNA-binding transcriptional regulator n=1 Tax=Chelativorans sp. TaxID=2203393 RepID=UPI0028121836|nr:LacI family DNA-binding transcriptional regulator [Chelativorans sp.]
MSLDEVSLAKDRQRKSVTLKDVSEAAGVSLITVSRALRQPDTVTPATRQRVHEAINATGYVPNLMARALVSSRSNIVGLAVPTISASLFADLAELLAKVLQEHGKHLLLGIYDWSPEKEYDVVTTFMGRQADALVLTGYSHSAELRQRLERFDGPIVEMGSIRAKPIDMGVGFDNFAAAAEMTRHLIDRGYRKIALVHGSTENNDQAAERYQAFRTVMREAGFSVDDGHIISVPTPTTMEQGHAAMFELLDSPRPPDAVFFQTDNLAHGAMMACLSRGVAVPAGVAIAGFGDLAMSALLPVPLTTVKARLEAHGREAASLILTRLRGERPISPVHDVGYELLIREST